MPRPQPARLKEADATPAPHARVIDAEFKVVGRKRRALAMLWRGLVAVFWAAVIGFLIPPAWVLIQEIGAMLRGG